MALLLGSIIALVVAVRIRHRWTRAIGLVTIALGATLFQVLHFAEHIAQFAHYVNNPGEAAFLSPWAVDISDGLSGIFRTSTGVLGVELLHLLGNSIFLVGVFAMAHVTYRDLNGTGRWALAAVAVQGFHVVEHVVLTASQALTGTAHGLSTIFASTGYRVTWHFVVNLAATILALGALRQLAGLVRSRRGELDPQAEPAPTFL